MPACSASCKSANRTVGIVRLLMHFAASGVACQNSGTSKECMLCVTACSTWKKYKVSTAFVSASDSMPLVLAMPKTSTAKPPEAHLEELCDTTLILCHVLHVKVFMVVPWIGSCHGGGKRHLQPKMPQQMCQVDSPYTAPRIIVTMTSASQG